MRFRPLLFVTTLLLLTAPWATTRCLAQAGPGMAPLAERVYFAEPGTGRKVKRYWVKLPFKDGAQRQFRIPCECPHILAELEFDEAARDRVMARSLWQKVSGDCRYMRFLTRHGTEPVIDHVSTFDFHNAAIDRFPLDPGCRRGERTPTAKCDPLRIDRRGMLRYFPLGQPATDEEEPGIAKNCELRDGLFQGRLRLTDTETRCFETAEAQGVRLTGVDFADVNGDGTLDAVLRLRMLGPISTQQILRLPLTRSSADADFTAPAPAIDNGVLP